MAFGAKRNLGMLLLAIYLIVQGAALVANLSFSGQPLVLGGLAIAAGVLLLLGQ